MILNINFMYLFNPLIDQRMLHYFLMHAMCLKLWTRYHEWP